VSEARTELGRLAEVFALPGEPDALTTVKLQKLFERFSRDELDVLGFVAERLDHGREQYGPLEVSTDPREWARELAEEKGDELVYGAAWWIRVAQLAGSRPRFSVIRPDGSEDLEVPQ
jgi:hypothetical protein